jgi:5'-phosphate synthase pdxT subunit
MTNASPKIGILAIQGDYAAHAAVLERLGVAHSFVLRARDLDSLDGVILPGGESTTMLKFLAEEGLDRALVDFANAGRGIFGTCAGTILLAREVKNPPQRSLNLLDAVVLRNAYGRQLASQIRREPCSLSDEPLEMVFIRAPIIESVGPAVEVLASSAGQPVLVRQAAILAATFHPELTASTAVHELFARMASAAVVAAGSPAPVATTRVAKSRVPGEHVPTPKKSPAATPKKTKVLFICLGNACRSPMAEAIARHRYADLIESSSAGLMALGAIASPTTAVLDERNVPSAGLASKPLTEKSRRAAELIINMSGRPGTWMSHDGGPPVEDWDVGDPYGSDLDVYRKICDDIERRLKDLALRLDHAADR